MLGIAVLREMLDTAQQTVRLQERRITAPISFPWIAVTSLSFDTT
jgi:hypothetical protein